VDLNVLVVASFDCVDLKLIVVVAHLGEELEALDVLELD
jgi:hypothetical protein